MQKLIKITDDHYVVVDDDGTRTHSTIDIKGVLPLSLEEVKELIGEVDVDKKVEEVYPQTYYSGIHIDGFLKAGYVKGYTQALEDNKEKKYTEDDLWKAVNCAYVNDGTWQECVDFVEEQVLQPKTEWEVEIVDGKLKLK